MLKILCIVYFYVDAYKIEVFVKLGESMRLG